MLVLILVLYPKTGLLMLQRPEMRSETIPTARRLGYRVASFDRAVWPQKHCHMPVLRDLVLVVFHRTHH